MVVEILGKLKIYLVFSSTGLILVTESLEADSDETFNIIFLRVG